MGLTQILGDVATLTAFTVGLSEKRFVKSDGTLCGAGVKALGVSLNTTDATSKTLSVATSGIVIVTAGGTCTINNECESTAEGKATNLSTGKSNGVLMDSGSSGQEVRVRLI